MIVTSHCEICGRPIWIRKKGKWEAKALQDTPKAWCPECDVDHLTAWKLGPPPKQK